PRREPRPRAPVSQRRHPPRVRPLARAARGAESAALRHVFHPGPGGIAVASRLRWLAAPFALIAFAASAQIDKLDLRLPKVTDGVVASIRQVNSGSETALAPRTGPR